MTSIPADQAQIEALVVQEVERRIGDLRRELKAEIDALRDRTVGNRVTMVVFSGDLDRVMASLVIATGAASMGIGCPSSLPGPMKKPISSSKSSDRLGPNTGERGISTP